MRVGCLQVYDRLRYDVAWELQRRLLRDRAEDRCLDTLVLLEHEPVFTIGRSARVGHWSHDESRLVRAGFSVYHVERGGSVTYHGPGQLVGYPILRLSDFCAGPKTYMRLLEEVIIRTLKEWGITAGRREKLTGVWVDGGHPAKIAAMGVKIERGITMHGFALNAAVDLAPFARIVPCGIEGCRVTSMAEVLGSPPDLSHLRARLAAVFAEVFGLAWMESPAASRPAAMAAQ